MNFVQNMAARHSHYGIEFYRLGIQHLDVGGQAKAKSKTFPVERFHESITYGYSALVLYCVLLPALFSLTYECLIFVETMY